MSWHISTDEPAPFELLNPSTVDQALDFGAKHNRDAAYLAGGCDLYEQLKHNWSTYHYVINLKQISGMRGVEIRDSAVTIGALTKLGDLEQNTQLAQIHPGLVHAATRVATPKIRNMGTIGGNILQDSRCFYYRGPWYCYRAGGIVCDAHHGVNSEHAIFGGNRCFTVSPSDTGTMLVALDAVAHIRGLEGDRSISMGQLFVQPQEDIRVMHRLRPDEILTSVEVPRQAGQRSTFIKYAMRNSWDFAVASVAISFRQEGGACRDCRIVLGAVAATPWRSQSAERVMEGEPLTPDNIEAAARAATEGAQPLAYNEYKIPLVRKLVREALMELSK